MTRYLKAFNRKIQGSTLVESLIAFSILLTLITVFLLVITRVESQNNPYQIYRAFHLANELFEEEDILIEQDEILEIEDLAVRKEIVQMENPGFYQVEIIVMNREKEELFAEKRIFSTRIKL